MREPSGGAERHMVVRLKGDVTMLRFTCNAHPSSANHVARAESTELAANAELDVRERQALFVQKLGVLHAAKKMRAEMTGHLWDTLLANGQLDLSAPPPDVSTSRSGAPSPQPGALAARALQEAALRRLFTNSWKADWWSTALDGAAVFPEGQDVSDMLQRMHSPDERPALFRVPVGTDAAWDEAFDKDLVAKVLDIRTDELALPLLGLYRYKLDACRGPLERQAHGVKPVPMTWDAVGRSINTINLVQWLLTESPRLTLRELLDRVPEHLPGWLEAAPPVDPVLNDGSYFPTDADDEWPDDIFGMESETPCEALQEELLDDKMLASRLGLPPAKQSALNGPVLLLLSWAKTLRHRPPKDLAVLREEATALRHVAMKLQGELVVEVTRLPDTGHESNEAANLRDSMQVLSRLIMDTKERFGLPSQSSFAAASPRATRSNHPSPGSAARSDRPSQKLRPGADS